MLAAVAKNKDEPVDIFGWSRGGIAAIALAHRLAKNLDADGKPSPIKVRFLGLVDPTAPLKGLDEGKEFHVPGFRTIDANVVSAALHRSRRETRRRVPRFDGCRPSGLRSVFQDRGYLLAPSTAVIVNKKLPLSHLESGYSATTWKLLFDAATKAGVAIDFGDRPPPWADPKYDDKPKQGESLDEILRQVMKKAR